MGDGRLVTADEARDRECCDGRVVGLSRLTVCECPCHRSAIVEGLDADDPLLDATDGAHPAWWRGHDHTAAKIAEARAELHTLRGQIAAVLAAAGDPYVGDDPSTGEYRSWSIAVCDVLQRTEGDYQRGVDARREADEYRVEAQREHARVEELYAMLCRERERSALLALLAVALRNEREACARECDDVATSAPTDCAHYANGAEHCAAAIRRGPGTEPEGEVVF